MIHDVFSCFCFFFKQKTAYEMRSSDWSSDVCSSDLALWEESPQTAAELTQRIGAANGWTQATVKTLIARLVQKGAVTAEADGRRYLYRPAIARADAVGAESQRFVDRLLDRKSVV